MIPQDVYTEISELFGIPHEVSDHVYELINTELHDVRKLPKKKFLLEIISTEESEDAFWMYCFLDLLSERLASAIILDIDPIEYKNDIFNGVKADLNPIVYMISKHTPIPISIKSLRKEFHKKLPIILRNEDLIRWIRENIVNPRISREEIPLEDAIREMYLRTLREKYMKSISQAPALKETHEKTTDRFMYSKLYYNIFKLISYRTRIYDYMILSGYSMNHISEHLFRVSRKKRAFLGRENLYCLTLYEDENKIRECISKYLDIFNEVYIKKHGFNLNSDIKKKYVEMIMEADRIIVTK